jgi:hypothetical protein
VNLWYRESISSRKFKTGLKEAAPFALTMARVALGVELKKGDKVKSKLDAISKEIERRRKSARGNDSRGQRRIG